MAAKNADKPLPQRLRAMRKVYGYKHANAFAAALSNLDPDDPVTANAWGNVEAGSSLSTKMMKKIARLCPDVTWEWLELGNERFLTVDMRQKLKAAATPSRPRGRLGGGRPATSR